MISLMVLMLCLPTTELYGGYSWWPILLMLSMDGWCVLRVRLEPWRSGTGSASNSGTMDFDIIQQGEYFYFIHSVQMMHQLFEVHILNRIYAIFSAELLHFKNTLPYRWCTFILRRPKLPAPVTRMITPEVSVLPCWSLVQWRPCRRPRPVKVYGKPWCQQ